MQTPFLQPGVELLQSQCGNMGEFISFNIARSTNLKSPNIQSFARNAIEPLAKISSSGIDLTYVYFDPSTPANDLLYIQEVKTTGADNLNYLGHLQSDYEKLFSLDLNLALRSRIAVIANSLELERNLDDYAKRLRSVLVQLRRAGAAMSGLRVDSATQK
jgi:hypothetical protein